MGCFCSKEKSVRLEDGAEKRTLSPANSRHELIISGLESNKFLPLICKPKKASIQKRALILRSNDVPLAAVLRSLNTVKGGNELSSADISPTKIIQSLNPSQKRLLPAEDDDINNKPSEDFSFFKYPRLGMEHMIQRPKESGAAIKARKIQENTHNRDPDISASTNDLRSVKVMSAPTQELLGQEVSIYSPSTYVTPRFGSYGLVTTL